jgi:hypothetical protein
MALGVETHVDDVGDGPAGTPRRQRSRHLVEGLVLGKANGSPRCTLE